MSDTQKTITIDGKEYDLASLPPAAKTQVMNVRTVDEEVRRIEQKLAIYKTARAAYAQALKVELDKMDSPASAQAG